MMRNDIRVMFIIITFSLLSAIKIVLRMRKIKNISIMITEESHMPSSFPMKGGIKS